MTMNNELIMILVVVVAFVYVQLIMRFTFGWFSLDKGASSTVESSFSTTFSIVIAARNEENNIKRCLEAIALQDYPVHMFELIIVNDHSTDDTFKIVDEFIEGNPRFLVRSINAKGEGKKRAIAEGVDLAGGVLVLVTDADCQMSEGWISSFAKFYEKKRTRFISGPVKMAGKGIFAGIQGLEFMSLIGSGAGSISAGMPVMCNGANLCFENTVFGTVVGFSGNQHYASGDDVFLMLKIKELCGSGSVAFLKDRAAIVTTAAQPDLRSFFRQRMRWTSKSPGYRDFGIILTAVSVLLINLGLLTGFVFGLLSGSWQPFLMLLISKLIIDFPMLIAVSSFMHQKRLLLYYLPVQILMPFYVVFTALGGLLSTVSWKGRPVK
jgi:glycosyltransferase involved in cell wall biosynthesis